MVKLGILLKELILKSAEDVERMLFNDYGICTNDVERYFRKNRELLNRFFAWVIRQYGNRRNFYYTFNKKSDNN